MKIVGLTGGIASGKSTVSAMLAELGAAVIDADRIAREVVRPGMPAYSRIVDHFGQAVLLPDGEIDRQALGDIVFYDAAQKEVLNAIVHPEVISAYALEIAALEKDRPEALVVMDVPLLLESRMHEGLCEVIVVYVPESLQRKRLMARDGISAADADARIGSQMPIEEKKRCATIVIDNTGDLAETRRQVTAAFHRLVS
ncbi:MAG: dephospho-CoA kinase [Pseudomonadota bacterium]